MAISIPVQIAFRLLTRFNEYISQPQRNQSLFISYDIFISKSSKI